MGRTSRQKCGNQYLPFKLKILTTQFVWIGRNPVCANMLPNTVSSSVWPTDLSRSEGVLVSEIWDLLTLISCLIQDLHWIRHNPSGLIRFISRIVKQLVFRKTFPFYSQIVQGVTLEGSCEMEQVRSVIVLDINKSPATVIELVLVLILMSKSNENASLWVEPFCLLMSKVLKHLNKKDCISTVHTKIKRVFCKR